MRHAVTYTLIGAFALAALIAGALPPTEAYFLRQEQTAAAGTHRIIGQTFDQAMARFAPLPQLVADDPILRDLLRQPDNAGLVPYINEKLRLTARALDVSDIFLMDMQGFTLAASNYRLDETFLGKNFGYRPYFQSAAQGETVMFHGLGVTSGVRGFFFSSPILDGIEVIGVLAVKISVAEIEAALGETARDVIVADPNGIAFLSSRADYRMRALAPLSEGQRRDITQTRQFPMGAITPLPLSAGLIADGVVELRLGAAPNDARYLSTSVPLGLAGWHSIVLTPLESIRFQALGALAVIALIVTTLILLIVVFYQRRVNFMDRLRLIQDQSAKLEQTVRLRTADLDATNASLLVEIAERKATEDQLRKSQKELIQAGKLAALGKMSAALSHEINQPLGAVKSYAYNAGQFLDRGRSQEARQNIERISEMTDRMTKIAKDLRVFARMPGDQLRAVPIGRTIQDALNVSAPQMREQKVQVHFEPPVTEVFGIGGGLRLQQVIVNLLNNAADAMAQMSHKRIEVMAIAAADQVSVVVRDFGPGLTEEGRDQVFDAFYTTKEAGAGMGLGLSISYNIIEDFGGAMHVENHADGGAVFTVVLKRANMDAEVER